jgi:hypothetical protein
MQQTKFLLCNITPIYKAHASNVPKPYGISSIVYINLIYLILSAFKTKREQH